MTKIGVCIRDENFCFAVFNMFEKMTEIKKSSLIFKNFLTKISVCLKNSGIGVLTADRRCPIKTKAIFFRGHIKTTVIYHIKMKITVGTYPAFLLPVCLSDGGTGFVNSAEASPRRTEGLLFTNPDSSAKISLAEDRRMTDKTSSLRESLFSRLYGV